jgi:Raf kinase inhibitor-like YbhB/YbcL family protein
MAAASLGGRVPAAGTGKMPAAAPGPREGDLMHRIVVIVAALLPLAAYAADKFTLVSAEVKPNVKIAEAQVYKGFDCNGGNVSPSLTWSNPPAGTKSFAVTVYDPDAPTGSGWWHWVVFDLPADTTTLLTGAGSTASGKIPKGAVQSLTDFGAPGYGGPCPPKGDRPHRYVFTVHALKVEKLDLDEKAMPALVGFIVTANRLDKATFTSTYSRK